MTKAEFQRAFERIESEALAGNMSISVALAWVAMVSIEFGAANSHQPDSYAGISYAANRAIEAKDG